ncbi:MAG: translation initiation factor IF-3, partial [Chitinivibrionia bacterium]|nr:translation initiation factor IF-3 [Chitinivibrionia bacterium]
MPAVRSFFLAFSGGKRTISRDMRIRVNRMIRVPEVRVVDNEGNQLGVMPTQQALSLADEQGYDLVEISPTSRPPVCRIMDFGKYKYETNKRLKQSKKKQHVIQVKEIKLRPKTEEHDY